ncbi:MAG: UvrD-helicase domain-containing protein, partial [Burkholderiales bacterium]|nr:UvrD-helicase domain-containing protein [Burkholderiales bacterium]
LARPASGERLRQHIRQQYPVALIDEFQDTSPLQYRLFDQIYDVGGADRGDADAENRSGCALLLIGDPKQSIYGFRGADIDSYLRARHATEGRHHVLGTNHRSSQAMVDAVNRLFAWREDAPGSGAFRYRTPIREGAADGNGGADAGLNPLPFLPVAAKGRADVLVQAGQPVPALTAEVDTTLHPSAILRRLFAARCAEQVVGWLNDPAMGFETPGGTQGTDDADEASNAPAFTRLRPADVAILVRTGSEARAVRRALQRRGVASVYLSDRESVFQSTEAADLLHWLQAVAHPRDARLVRAGLATRLVGLDLAELATLAQDDDVLDARMSQLDALRTEWQQRGVQAMLRQTLQRLQLP